MIIKYPNEILTRKCVKVELIDEKIIDICNQMIRDINEFKGIGLSAPQIGYNLRIFCIRCEKIQFFINPEIEPYGNYVPYIEGCLSFPNIFGKVNRREKCKIKAYTIENKEFQADVSELTSRVIQHEYDHLEGKLFITRMTFEERKKIKHLLK